MHDYLPAHIRRIVRAIEGGEQADQVLLSALALLPRDFCLVNIYLHLGFRLETNSFITKPTPY